MRLSVGDWNGSEKERGSRNPETGPERGELGTRREETRGGRPEPGDRGLVVSVGQGG